MNLTEIFGPSAAPGASVDRHSLVRAAARVSCRPKPTARLSPAFGGYPYREKPTPEAVTAALRAVQRQSAYSLPGVAVLQPAAGLGRVAGGDIELLL